MKTKAIVGAIIVAGCVILASPAQAATRTWNGLGANNNWTNSSNWGGTAPVAGDDLVFPGTGVDLTSFNNTNTFPNKTPFSSITIGGTNYVLNGAAIYFTNTGVTAINATNTAGATTINFGFLFDTIDQTITCASASAVLDINGDVDIGPVGCIANCVGEIQLGGALGGGTGLTKDGAGKLVLNSPANNSYNGTTAVNAGTVELNGASPMIPGTLVINSGATVTLKADNQIGFGTAGDVTVVGTGLLNLNGFSDGIGALTLTSGGDVSTGFGTLTLGGNVTASGLAGNSCTISGKLALGSATRTFAVSDDSGTDPDLDVTAVVSGSASSGLIKSAAGQMRLTAANTYLGDTMVSAGILRVHGSQPNSRILLANGTLAGVGPVGEIAGAGVGTVSPGASPGILTSSNVVLGVGRTLTVEINGTTAGSGYDQLLVNGSVTLGGNLSLSNTIIPTLGTVFTIINNDGAEAVTNTFSGLTEASSITNGGAAYRISYVGGDGNDVTLTSVLLPSGITKEWDGGGTDVFWSEAANWVGDVVPTNGDSLYFPPGASRGDSNNDLPSGTAIHSVLIASNYNFFGGSLIQLNAGLRCTNGSPGILFPLRLLASQTFSNATGESLIVQSVDLVGNTLTVHANGFSQISGAITGAGGLIKTGPDELRLTASNSYAGLTVVSNGILSVQNNFALGSTAGGTSVTTSGQLSFLVALTTSEPFQLNGGVKFTGGNSTLAGTIQLPSAIAELDVTAGATVDFNGVISGIGGLRKVDNGTLRLNANNTYTGPTQLRAGSLAINGSQPSSAVDLALPTQSILEGVGSIGTLTVGTNASDTGNVHPGGDGTPGTLTVLGSYVTGHPLGFGNQLHMDLQSATNDLLRVSGDVVLGPGTALGLNAQLMSVGTSKMIIDNQGANPVSGTMVGLPEGSTIVTSNMVLQITYAGGTGNDVVLTVVSYTPTGVTRVWDGGAAGSAAWSNPTNWAGDVVPNDGDSLVFPTGASQLLNSYDFASVRVFDHLTFGVAGYDVGNLTSNQMLLLGGIQCTQASGSVVFRPAIRISNVQTVSVASASASLSFPIANLTNSLNADLWIQGPGLTTFGGILVGTGGFEIDGRLELFGTNTYSGVTHVRSGASLFVSDALALGAASGNTIVDANAVILPSAGVNCAEPLSLAGTMQFNGASTWSGPLTLTGTAPKIDNVPIFNAATLSGPIGGTAPFFVITGGGRTSLTASNSYSGIVSNVATSGLSELFVNDVLPATLVNRSRLSGTGVLTSIIVTNGDLLALSPGVNGPGVLTCSNLVMALVFAEQTTIEINGTTPGSGHDQLRVLGSASVFGSLLISNTLSPASGAVFKILDNQGGSPVSGTYSGLPEGASITNNGVKFQISYVGGDGNDVTLTRVFVSSGITRTWDGGGGDNLWSSATNWVGDVAPTNGDSLYFPPGAPQALSINDLASGTAFQSILVASNYDFFGGSLIQLNAGLRCTNGFVGVGCPLRLLASQTFSNATGGTLQLESVDLMANTLTVIANAQTTIAGSVVGAGGIIKDGTGQMSLSASNSYDGPTIVSNGLLSVQNSFALGSAAGSTVVSSNAQIHFSGVLTVAEPLQLSGNVFFFGGNSTLTGTIQLPGAVLDINVLPGLTADINGVISGAGGWGKFFDGTLRLNANNIYTGPTQIREGTLLVNGSQPSSPVDVGGSAAAILAGFGNIGTLTVATNALVTGSVYPGGPVTPGTLNIFGSYITGHPFSTGNVLVMDLEQTTNDLLRVHGDVILGPGTSLALLHGDFTNGSTLTIIENLGTNPVSGTFSALPEGGLIPAGSQAFRISYVGGTGNDVTLTVRSVPSLITNAVVVTNAFHLTGLGISNAPYILEASTNLVNWSTIQTNMSDGSGAYLFVDPNFGLFPARFYRVQSP